MLGDTEVQFITSSLQKILLHMPGCKAGAILGGDLSVDKNEGAVLMFTQLKLILETRHMDILKLPCWLYMKSIMFGTSLP